MPQAVSKTTLANAIRALSMDGVQAANSGHPGAPMGMADIAEVLWNDFLKHNPANPDWPNRDRFVLSNGHGSMLIYSLLHLSGYDLPIEELKNFRQFGAKTPGHPENFITKGIETTTGPLGQGITNAVGMALAEKMLAAQYNRDGFNVVDHNTWCFLGDGCLMEGISHEACSLAGTLGLDKLIAIYDDNNISIDGEVGGWFADDTPKRFEAYGWHVVPNVDGHDAAAISAAIAEAKAADKPALICCKTIIGKGSPNKSNSSGVHGSPLGDDEIQLTRESIGWNHPPFEIPQDVYDAWNGVENGQKAEAQWVELFHAYQNEYPAEAAELVARLGNEMPSDWNEKLDAAIASAESDGVKVATRKASEMALNVVGPLLPQLVGGSADLTGSNNTWWSGSKDVTKDDAAGNYLRYGVREFGMSAMMNGMALHGGLLPYAGTFLVFSDYARNAIRMAALMGTQSIFVLTHDSIGLGEDGPTHQPVEHTASLRLMPNMDMWRPADAVETLVAWRSALERKDGPSGFALTRQGLPHQNRSSAATANIMKGGYVLSDSEGTPDVILIGTGSELYLCTDAAEALRSEGKNVRVVSMPCVEAFERQSDTYQESVLPKAVTNRVAVEAGVTSGWYKYVGTNGAVIGLDRYGISAPANEIFEHFGFTAENVANTARKLLS